MEGSYVWRRRIAAPLAAALIALTADPRGRGAAIAGGRHGERSGGPGHRDRGGAGALVRRSPAGAPARWNVTTPKRQLQAQVLQLLISFAWIEGEARALGVTVTDAEVKASFDEQKQQSFPKAADFRKFLRTSGQTRKRHPPSRAAGPALERDPRPRRRARPASVTEADIDAYIAETRADRRSPSSATCGVVLTKTRAQAQQARSALERGATWKQVARRYSIDEVVRGATAGASASHAKGTLVKRLDRAGLPRPPRPAGRPGQDAVRLLRLQGRPRPARVGGARRSSTASIVREQLESEARAGGAGHVRAHLHGDLEGAHDLRARVRLGHATAATGTGPSAQARAPSRARSSTPASRRPASSSCPSSRWLNESRISLCPSSPT